MSPDVILLLLMAVGDLCLIVHLRRRRARYMRMDRMTRSLQLHIRGELTSGSVVAPPRRRTLERVS